MKLPYDASSQDSIEKYAKKLLNKSLRQVLPESYFLNNLYSSANKGGVGQTLEKLYFLYEPNSNSEPDFPAAELELKSTPLKRLKNKKYVAKERLVLNIINYETEGLKTWKTSSFWEKNKNLLLMFYLHQEGISIWDLVFKLIGIWRYPERDLKIIRNDWETIVRKIRDGKAHELSEGDTLYLAACVKGPGGEKTLRDQSDTQVKATQRAFSLKKKYVDMIISQWIGDSEYSSIESVVKKEGDYQDSEETFEELVKRRFNPYLGMSIEEIREMVGKDLNPLSKNYFSRISLRILGVKGERVEEFEKAEIIIRTVRLKQNNIPKEDVSFPRFKYKELVTEDWETSTLLETLSRRFFFVLFKYDENNRLVLRKVEFWTMPIKDLPEVKRVWQETVDQILSGRADDLPKKSDSPVCHVRPHARNSNDRDETPDGRLVVKKCFWLNAGYISEQLTKGLD